MDKRDDGGSAFPVLRQHSDNFMAVVHEGMTLRDYFAAKAIAPAMHGAQLPKDTWHEMLPIVARFSYAIADAMLKERAK